MITGVVLAAGTSTRLGSTKQLLSLDGRPLVRHALDAALGAGLQDIVIVIGHDADRVRGALGELPAAARVVTNPTYAEGQSSSLAAGLRAASEDSEAAIVLLADQPGVSPETIRALVEAFLASRARIVRASYRDGPGPSLLSRDIWAEASHLRGDTGARALIAEHPDWVERVVIDDDSPPDVDTPQDAAAIGARPPPG